MQYDRLSSFSSMYLRCLLCLLKYLVILDKELTHCGQSNDLCENRVSRKGAFKVQKDGLNALSSVKSIKNIFG